MRGGKNLEVCDSLGVCGGADYIQHEVGFGKHGDVAALDLISGGAHLSRTKCSGVRLFRATFRGALFKERFRLLSDLFERLFE